MKQSIESTSTLLLRVKNGDTEAQDQLCSIYIPILSKWAHGRLPSYARELSDTDDLVQNTLISVLNRVHSFESVREGAFLVYLRKALLNNIRMEIRRSHSAIKDNLEQVSDSADPNASLLENAIGLETLENYEAALMQLNAIEREAVILRVEFGFEYLEIAAAIEVNSANAACMKVTRALAKLARSMQ